MILRRSGATLQAARGRHVVRAARLLRVSTVGAAGGRPGPPQGRRHRGARGAERRGRPASNRDDPDRHGSVGDPVGNGLVASLARPGGNVTGTSFLTSAMVGKQLDLLKQITPHASRLAILLNPANPGHPLALEEAKVAAHSLGVPLQAIEARGPADFDKAFAAMTRERSGALFVPWDGTFLLHVRIVHLAAKTRLAAMYGQRRYVDVGGLASYGPSARESFRNGAAFVNKILKGAKPGDLPIQQPTKFELVINLTTEGPRPDDPAVASPAGGSGNRLETELFERGLLPDSFG